MRKFELAKMEVEMKKMEVAEKETILGYGRQLLEIYQKYGYEKSGSMRFPPRSRFWKASYQACRGV